MGPKSSIHTDVEARDDRRPGTRQGRLEKPGQFEESYRRSVEERRATEGRWKRALARMIKEGEEQVVRASPPGLVSGPPARVTRTP